MPVGPALTQLIPIQELAPGAVAAIRNQVINALVAQVSRELGLPPEQLVVRDVRPLGDLQLYGAGTTDVTSERWGFVDTGTSPAYVAINGVKTMGDQRYVALFGVRDRHSGAASGSATLAVLNSLAEAKQCVSLIKINVGGGDKAIWDISSMYTYRDAKAGFSPSAVIIPQNATFVISYYKMGSIEVGAVTAPVSGEIAWLQLVGVVVEPRGKVISP